MMLWAIPGILLLGASVACFAYFLPRKGEVHPWVVLPVLDSVIPLVLLTSAVFGTAALVAAFL
jgi:hypothetical protein